MDVPLNNPQDNRLETSNNDDIMLSRRLKNRERQRRYRERKRLQTDMKVLDTNQLALLQVELPVTVAPQDSVSAMTVSPLDCVMPMNVAPQDSVLPVTVAPLDSAVTVNITPQDYVKPVTVTSGECVMSVSSASREYVTRVYSGRNWKSDARKAHEVRPKEVSSNGSFSPGLASTAGSQAPHVPHIAQADVPLSSVVSSPVSTLETNRTPKSIPSRRHWKAEARNKKS